MAFEGATNGENVHAGDGDDNSRVVIKFRNFTLTNQLVNSLSLIRDKTAMESMFEDHSNRVIDSIERTITSVMDSIESDSNETVNRLSPIATMYSRILPIRPNWDFKRILKQRNSLNEKENRNALKSLINANDNNTTPTDNQGNTSIQEADEEHADTTIDKSMFDQGDDEDEYLEQHTATMDEDF